MVKKILLTLSALVGSCVISLFSVVIIKASILGDIPDTSNNEALGGIVLVLALLIFIFFNYLIWKSAWKTTFFVIFPIMVIAVGQDLTHLNQFRPFDYISDIDIIIALIGLFAYTFKKLLFPKAFWKIFFFWFAFDIIYSLIIRIVPQSILNLPEFMYGYNTKLNINQIPYETITFIIIITSPLLYAIFNLGYRNLQYRSGK